MNSNVNSIPNIGQILLVSLNNALYAIIVFIPKFVAGLIIILIGVIVASIVRQLVAGALKALNVDKFLKKYNVPEGKNELSWINILGEIVRWFIIIIFIIPTAEIWGISQVSVVLRSFLLYLPNVFIAVIIGIVGFVVARLAYDVVLASTQGVSSSTSRMFAAVTQYAINIFTVLVVLTQLNVAADLIKILFQGFVAMVAIAGGIAFGFGGQKTAQELLENLKENISGGLQKNRNNTKTPNKSAKK